MNARDRLTQAAVAIGRPLNALAYGMVEDEDPVGTGRGLDQPFRLGIVDVLDLVFVVEVLYRTFLPDQRKPVSIERNRLADRTDVRNRQTVRFRPDVRPGFAEWRIEGVGPRPVRRKSAVKDFYD